MREITYSFGEFVKRAKRIQEVLGVLVRVSVKDFGFKSLAGYVTVEATVPQFVSDRLGVFALEVTQYIDALHEEFEKLVDELKKLSGEEPRSDSVYDKLAFVARNYVYLVKKQLEDAGLEVGLGRWEYSEGIVWEKQA